MGRVKEHNRKISNDRVKKERKQKNKILIAVEGNNKTEKLYFSNFEDRSKPYNITFAKGNNTDPLNLVTMLIKEIKKLNLDLADGDVAYCIFDTDIDPNKNKVIEDAVNLANEHNIKIITSTPCIELWFLLHYVYTTASMSNDDVIRKLKEHYPKYTKSSNIYPDILPNMDSAIESAKRLEKHQIQVNRKIGTVEANPNTEIYKIVEYLLQN